MNFLSDIKMNNKEVGYKSDIALNRTTLGTQCKNLLNETEYLASIESATNGTLSKSGNSITLTATSNDCYLIPFFANDNGYRIPVSPNTTYILSWESDNSNYGIIHVFMNGIIAKQQSANNSVTKYLKFITDIDATFITIRFSVKNPGDSITYSNIMLRYADITDDTYEPYKENIDERLIQNKSDITVNKSTLGYQCKNLHDTLSVNWYQPDKTNVASDGTVTTTITSDSRSFTYANSEHYITLEAGKYIITANTLEFVAGSSALIRGCNSDNQSLFALSVSSAGLHEAAFSLSKKTTIGIMYKLYSQTCTIMIRDADILDDTYEVYKANVNERLIEDKSNIAINKSTLGYTRKNLLKLTLTTTTTVSGITFTVNDDCSITLNGTATAII